MKFLDWIPLLLVILLLIAAIVCVVVGISTDSIGLFSLGLLCWALFLLALMHG